MSEIIIVTAVIKMKNEDNSEKVMKAIDGFCNTLENTELVERITLDWEIDMC